MATTRLYAPRPYDEFDSGVAGVAPILSTGTDVDNTKVTAVQAAATASGIGTLPTSAGGTAPAPVAEPLRFRGPWQISTVYSYGDVVSQAGSLYVAPSAFTSGSSFVAGNWTKLGVADATDPSFSATYSAVAAARDTARMLSLGASDRQRSAGLARVAYDDAAVFLETWANLTAWTLDPTPGLQISGNKAFANGSTGGKAGATHAWNLGTTGTGRAVFIYNHVGQAGTGDIIIGVSKDAAGATPAVGAANARGIDFRPSASIRTWDQGVATDTTLGAGSGAQTYVITVTADANYLSIVARRIDGQVEARVKFARAGFSIATLFVFNSDSNQLTGSSFGRVSSRDQIATAQTRAGVEDVGGTVQWTANGNAAWRLVMPTSYDSRKPVPLAICFHGNGSDETTFATNANGMVVANALTVAGYAVLSVAYTPTVSNWGAQNGLDAVYTAYKAVRDAYPIGPVVFYANSMGGLDSLLSLANRRIPGVVAWVGTSPATNLADNYANSTFTATINTAYGITGTPPNDYATLTSGHDPNLKAGDAFRGVPMLFLAASDDVTVPKATNTDLLAALVASYAVEATVTTTTGGHSFDFTPYTGQITAFFDKYVTA